MKSKGLLVAIAILAIAVVVYFAFFTGKGEEESDVIKIGFIGPLTGPAASYGINARNGALIAVEQINAAGGVLDGKKLQLIVEDDKGDTTEATNVFNKLVEQDKVVAIVGPVTTGPTTVVARLAGEERIPIVSPTATGDDITKVSDFVARVCFYDSYQAPVMAVFAVES